MSPNKSSEAVPGYSLDYTETYAIGVALGAAQDAVARAQGLASRGAHNPSRPDTRFAIDRARRAVDYALRRVNDETRVILDDQHPGGRK